MKNEIKLTYGFLLVFSSHIPCFVKNPCSFCLINSVNFEIIKNNFGEYFGFNSVGRSL